MAALQAAVLTISPIGEATVAIATREGAYVRRAAIIIGLVAVLLAACPVYAVGRAARGDALLAGASFENADLHEPCFGL